MKILLTGGAGFHWQPHLCRAFRCWTRRNCGADNFVNSQPEAMRRVEELCGKTIPVYNVDMLRQGGDDACI